MTASQLNMNLFNIGVATENVIWRLDMTGTIAELFGLLVEDKWRKEASFSEDMEYAHQQLFGSEVTEHLTIETLKEWLQKNQPCLFGRIAARLDLITFCILTETDLLQSDEHIHKKIQKSRLLWTQEAFKGRKSAFVILAILPRIAFAIPNEAVENLAERLCYLYLEEEIKSDNIYLDQLFLEKPDNEKTTWRFYSGVNYFSSQGDKRWWHDHRIPGGLAFSINSVAHLVKSGQIAANIELVEKELNFSIDEGWIKSPVDSLEKALEIAMRTISMAADTVSGKATELITLPENLRSELLKCPVELPKGLADKNHCQYRGYYHTDYTIPSEYFLSNVERPSELKPHLLDFTYLFHKDISNPDYFTMGEGKQIRDNEKYEVATVSTQETKYYFSKNVLGKEEIAPLSDYEERVIT